MTDKSWKLFTKLINACGYDITQIEDEFDFDELCEDIKNRLGRYHKALKEIEEYQKLKQECEELKKELDLYKTWYRAKHDDIKNYLGRCYKALERIKYEATEEMKDLEADTNVYGCFMEILNIINEAKGEIHG